MPLPKAEPFSSSLSRWNDDRAVMVSLLQPLP